MDHGDYHRKLKVMRDQHLPWPERFEAASLASAYEDEVNKQVCSTPAVALYITPRVIARHIRLTAGAQEARAFMEINSGPRAEDIAQ
jgi:hypothetical protein